MDTSAILDPLVSHALGTGLFERVNLREPKSAPGNGLTAAIWGDRIGPVPAGSGLTQTSGRVVFNLRLYQSMLAEPQDLIDPTMLSAVDALMGAYSGDFSLGENVRNIDLLGAHGVALEAQAGYLNQDGRLFRVYTMTVPVIINDMWEQIS